MQNRFLVLLVIGLLIAANWLGGGAFAMWAMAAALPWAIRGGSRHTVNLVLIFLASYLVPRLFPTFPQILAAKASGIIVFFYFALLLMPLRGALDWLRPGRLNRTAAILAIAVIALSAAGLIAWVHFAGPRMDRYARTLPDLSPRLLIVYMGGFAILNSLIEEIMWRGVMLSALDTALGAGALALLIQALSFGMAHFRGGFPNGWTGAFLAGLFGLAMGLLRRRSKGLLVPWCAHAGADVAVICLIVHFAHQG